MNYYNGMFILFKTGLRISEFCGLTVKDIDLQERKINVNHQLQRTRGMQYVIEDTKTSSGTRMFPMTDRLLQCFGERKNRYRVYECMGFLNIAGERYDCGALAYKL